ncbi:MAG: phospholipase D family protein [Cyanosarcina radialis HA8281-LM2]|jgi:hypothetical protein|nr:phospholipase D family protein [Cyanosarcina radialis HA8281-LM2]
MDLLGNKLKQLCHSARTEIVIVAPFIKAAALKEILTSIEPHISIKCVTRWLIEEILIGVSDLEVWSIIQSHPQASLWLRNDLHAKYYRSDDRCLVGSANLTDKALGWSNRSNLELLVELPANYSSLLEFEQELEKKCIQVDSQLHEQYVKLVNQLENQNIPLDRQQLITTASLDNENWLPILRNPEELYIVYIGREDKLTAIARKNALYDLQFLQVAPNLDRHDFNRYVGILLLQKSIIQEIDNFVKIPQRFGAVRDIISSLLCAQTPNFDPERSWQTLMRWLLYFLPYRYALSVPNYSEVFYRIQ